MHSAHLSKFKGRSRIYAGNRQSLDLLGTLGSSETICSLNSQNLLMGFRPQSAIITFVFWEGHSGGSAVGKGNYGMVAVCPSGNCEI